MWDLISPVTITSLILGLMAMSTAKVFEGPIKGGKYGNGARWFAFGLSIVAGLLLAVFLIPLMRWIGRLGDLGVIGASVGTIVTVLLGWQAVYLIIAAIRDLLDKTPDAEARKAARWVPTFLPVGGTAIFTLVSNPRVDGFGLGVSVLTAAIVSAITMGFTFRIFKALDLSKNGRNGWKWFAAVVAFLAGLIHIALVAYLDGVLANFIPGGWMAALRIVLGGAGIFLAVAGIRDFLQDGLPDRYVRNAGVFGVPLLSLFFSLAVTALTDNANSGIEYLASGGIG